MAQPSPAVKFLDKSDTALVKTDKTTDLVKINWQWKLFNEKTLIPAKNKTLPPIRNSHTTSRKNANLTEWKRQMQTKIWYNQRSSKYPIDFNLAQKQSKMFNGVERCLRNRADGSWARLICRVSNYDNRLISFVDFSPTHPLTLFAFSCQMYTNLTYLQRNH